MNLKVGDKIKVRSDLKEGMHISAGVVEDMVAFAGQICTIKEVIRDDHYLLLEDYNLCPYSWTEEMFEPIEKEKTLEEEKTIMREKMLDISEVKQAKDNISDLKVYGDGDTFQLLCKASSQEQGWMKSTKVCNVHNGCIVQVTTQQRNPDGSYAVAEALSFVPDVNIDNTTEPRKLVPIIK